VGIAGRFSSGAAVSTSGARMARKVQEDTSRLPAGAALKRQKAGEWEQMLRRYPLASPWGLAFQIGSTLFGNALVVWLVASGRMTPFELVLLVAIEALLLIGIAWLQSRLVPPEAIERNPMPWRERLGTLAFMLVWLGGVYSFVFFGMVPSGAEMLAALRDPFAFLAGSTLKWPLLITLVTALVDALQDAAHFRRHGGMFLSTPGFQGAARLLTLVLGGIPFAVPFFGAVIGLKLAVEKIHARLTRDARRPNRNALVVTLLVLAVVALIWGVAAGIDRIDLALQRGVAWWALCYGAAKFVSELFIVSLPLIATKAKAEDEQKAAAGGAKAPPGKRRR
jgi:hypothetical protein